MRYSSIRVSPGVMYVLYCPGGSRTVVIIRPSLTIFLLYMLYANITSFIGIITAMLQHKMIGVKRGWIRRAKGDMIIRNECK